MLGQPSPSPQLKVIAVWIFNVLVPQPATTGNCSFHGALSLHAPQRPLQLPDMVCRCGMETQRLR